MYLEIIIYDSLIYTMDRPKFIVSNQKDAPISIQRVKQHK